jgi:hypothetical protein
MRAAPFDERSRCVVCDPRFCTERSVGALARFDLKIQSGVSSARQPRACKSDRVKLSTNSGAGGHSLVCGLGASATAGAPFYRHRRSHDAGSRRKRDHRGREADPAPNLVKDAPGLYEGRCGAAPPRPSGTIVRQPYSYERDGRRLIRWGGASPVRVSGCAEARS